MLKFLRVELVKWDRAKKKENVKELPCIENKIAQLESMVDGNLISEGLKAKLVNLELHRAKILA